MGFPRPFFRAAVAAVATSALVASGLALAAPASADPANPTPVSGTALPTAQVNGVVWTQVVSNGIDYVGGSFNESQPAGAAEGISVSARSNLFAYDVSTGVAVAGFNATTNAQVRGIAASPDGSRIYIVGDFTTVNGKSRNHIAALDRNGNLIDGFAPSVNGNLYAVATRGDIVYIGGSFSAVNGTARSRAAAVNTTGSVLEFAPVVADQVVRAVAVSRDGSKILLGGSFTQVNGSSFRGLAAVTAATGASLPWAANSVIYNSGKDSAIYSLSTRGDVVYATGYVWSGVENGNLEGSVAMNWSDGSIKWLEDCHGDTYSSYPFNDALYIAGHPHYCANVGGFGELETPHRALGFSQSATHTLATNTEQGPGTYADFGGTPAPTLLNWYPVLKPGTYTGMYQAAWSVAGGGSYLAFAGEFTAVNGVRQTGLVRFQGQPEPEDTTTSTSPTAPSPSPSSTPTGSSPTSTPAGSTVSNKPTRVSTPNAVALGPTQVAVKWTAPKKAAADKISGYIVKLYKGGKAVKSTTLGKTKRTAVFTGLKRSTAYKIGVAARNSRGTGALSHLDAVKTKAKGKNVSATKKPSKVAKPSAGSGSARLRVRWTTASVTGALAVAKYQVRVVLHGKTVKTFTVNSASRSKLVTKLKHKTGYTVSVRASNWAGWGSWSTARSVKTK